MLLLAIVLTAAATGAQAQSWSRPIDRHDAQLDRHRANMDRLRLEADQRDLRARQGQLDARLTRREIEDRRQPEPVQPYAVRAPTVEEARVAREAATRRRGTTAAGVGQIDSWLDRSPD